MKESGGKIGLFLALALVVAVFAAPYHAHAMGAHHAKNIIFMVPDGMGLSNVTAARIYWNGIDGRPLDLETLDHVGYQRTYSRNQTITDSAPAASAWACGEKFNDGEICFHGEGEPNPASILELAKKRGKKTGLVATSTITHATPAAFAAHVQRRNCEYEIARQYVEQTQPDVMLGGGIAKFVSMSTYDRNSATCPAIDHGDLPPRASRNGYGVVSDKAAMEAAVADGARKLLGLFNAAGMLPECKRLDTPFGDARTDLLCMDKTGPVATSEPRLVDMTNAALKILDKNKDGFFLMVEGSQIDWANHAKDFEYQLGETLAFDEAVRAVKEWMNAHPARKENTLLIIVADHDCGGMQINGPYGAGKLITKGKIEPGWTSKEHTGVDTIIWSRGPQSHRLAKGALENTFLYDVMKSALQGR
jgi:alkaline phosphatase